MEIKIIKEDQPITKEVLRKMAKEMFGNLVKAVVDVDQGIMAVGGEFHSDAEVLLSEQENSRREHTWGINLRLEEPEEKWIEFDSMVNLKPPSNRTRGVENESMRQKIKEIVKKLVTL